MFVAVVITVSEAVTSLTRRDALTTGTTKLVVRTRCTVYTSSSKTSSLSSLSLSCQFSTTTEQQTVIDRKGSHTSTTFRPISF